MRLFRGLVLVAALGFALPTTADRMPGVNSSSVTPLDADTFWLLGAGAAVVAAFRRERHWLTTRDALHRFTVPRRTPSRGGATAARTFASPSRVGRTTAHTRHEAS